ncbi:M23 family metallopeptidase [Streptomyces sp. NPDC056161]|uniref:M23 family metallopeptidase n=1 Tax=Streptomyces sp. NPDC056161 TaxID=3345732 RepID=UPI0035E00DE5
MFTSLCRAHGPVFVVGAVLVVVNGQGLGPLWWAGVALLLVGMVMRWVLVRAQRPPPGRVPVRVGVPVAGRWEAANGPATKIPSHTHSHAQTYAIDLIHRPRASGGESETPAVAPEFAAVWPPVRRPERYPAFGRPVPAPGDGRVVAAVGGHRDHLTRTSLPGFAYLGVEGFVRTLGRRGHLFGNHLVLDLGDGVYACFAHLRRGSLRVSVGDRVSAGQRLADCGNSGNSSEPHLHFQLMDGPDPVTARGVPFEWRYVDDDGETRTGVPGDGTCFVPAPVRPAGEPTR